MALNEIYAKHGKKFEDKEVMEYFESKTWYEGTIEDDAFDESVLNPYEKTISNYSKRKKINYNQKCSRLP